MSITTPVTPTEVNQGSSNTSRVINMPASLADGDGAVLAVMTATNVVPTLTAAGLSRTWTLEASVAVSGKALHVWSVTDLEVADSSEPVTIATGSTSCKVSAIVEPIRGCSLVDIIGAVATKNGTPSALNPTTPLLTTTYPDSGILYIVGMRDNDTGSGGTPITSISPATGQGITEDADAYTTGTASLSGLCVARDWTPRASGYNVPAATFDADHAAVYCAVTIEIRPGNSAPVAYAGPDVEVDAGDIAYITGATATDSDGTVEDIEWTVLSSPSGSGVDTSDLVNPTIISPSLDTTLPGAYVLQVEVTDDLGAVHTDTMTIWAVTETPRIRNVTAAGGWTAVGAASIVAALADDNPATYAQSSGNPVNDILVGELDPIPAGAKSFTTTLVNDVDTPLLDATLELLNRDTGTLVATQDVEGIDTTEVEVEWVLDAPENGAVLDSHKLNVRITANTAA